MTDYEIEAFGRRLGLTGLALDESGRVSLKLSDLGELTLTETDGGLRLTLSRAQSSDDTAPYERLLASIDWHKNPPFLVQAAFFRRHLILSLALEDAEVTAAGLENALRFAVQELNRALQNA